MIVNDKIVTHPGTVKKVADGKAQIAVIAKAGCASCQLKGVCSVGEVEEKVVEVSLDNGKYFEEGEQVTVVMKRSSGAAAVLLGYVFPFVVLLTGLVFFLHLDLDQGMAGLLALLLLVPYYGLLYLLKDFFQRKFNYKVYRR